MRWLGVFVVLASVSPSFSLIDRCYSNLKNRYEVQICPRSLNNRCLVYLYKDRTMTACERTMADTRIPITGDRLHIDSSAFTCLRDADQQVAFCSCTTNECNNIDAVRDLHLHIFPEEVNDDSTTSANVLESSTVTEDVTMERTNDTTTDSTTEESTTEATELTTEAPESAEKDPEETTVTESTTEESTTEETEETAVTDSTTEASTTEATGSTTMPERASTSPSGNEESNPDHTTEATDVTTTDDIEFVSHDQATPDGNNL